VEDTNAEVESLRIVESDRFGERAVKLGLCDENDVLAAVENQRQLAAKHKPHKLIGLVLLEMGVIDNNQLIRILRTYETNNTPVE